MEKSSINKKITGLTPVYPLFACKNNEPKEKITTLTEQPTDSGKANFHKPSFDDIPRRSLRPFKNTFMPKFIIERNIPDAGGFSPEKLKAISQKSREVLTALGTDIQWIHSYVAGDKIYCIYLAPNEDLIREHAQRAGFPASRITQVSNIIDLSTAD